MKNLFSKLFKGEQPIKGEQPKESLIGKTGGGDCAPVFTQETDKKAGEMVILLKDEVNQNSKSCSTLAEAYKNPQFIRGMSQILSHAATDFVKHFKKIDITEATGNPKNKGTISFYGDDIAEAEKLQDPMIRSQEILPQIMNMNAGNIALPKETQKMTKKLLQQTFGYGMEGSFTHSIGKEAQATALRTLELLFTGKEIPDIFKDEDGKITLEKISTQLEEKNIFSYTGIDSTGYIFDLEKKDYFNAEGKSLLEKIAKVQKLKELERKNNTELEKNIRTLTQECNSKNEELQKQINEIGISY